MRKIVLHMQTTLDNRIAKADGTFWEPFAWGDAEQAHLNDVYRSADTWAMSRVMYEAIVPWWHEVAAGKVPDDVPAVSAAELDFARQLAAMEKVVFSRTMGGPGVIEGDLAEHLAALKDQDGGDIILSGGPQTLGPLFPVIDEMLLAVHPVVLGEGPGLFDAAGSTLVFERTDVTPFAGGCTLMRYRGI
jgi:dihydrofolate reductase